MGCRYTRSCQRGSPKGWTLADLMAVTCHPFYHLTSIQGQSVTSSYLALLCTRPFLDIIMNSVSSETRQVKLWVHACHVWQESHHLPEQTKKLLFQVDKESLR